MAVTTNDTGSAVLYRARHERNCDETLSDSIVEALAAVENVEPYELDVRLYDSLDPEALDRLYETTAEGSERLRLAFTVGGYEVVVTDDDQILVRAESEFNDRRR